MDAEELERAAQQACEEFCLSAGIPLNRVDDVRKALQAEIAKALGGKDE